jgi:hypothetical protein
VPTDSVRNLRVAVVASCKTPTSCRPTDSCLMLRLEIATKGLCIAAQTALTLFGFPDSKSHQQRIEDEKRGIKKCIDILFDKELRCQCK